MESRVRAHDPHPAPARIPGLTPLTRARVQHGLLADPSHPPAPTHNHIFLCGGLGEWMHRSLGGIAPAADGYTEVAIAPRISRDLGPSAVNMSLATVRGRIESSWVREGSLGGTHAHPEKLLTLRVLIPIGVRRAHLLVPLLGERANAVRLHESGVAIWPVRGPVRAAVHGIESIHATAGREGEWPEAGSDMPSTDEETPETLRVVLTSGRFVFELGKQ